MRLHLRYSGSLVLWASWTRDHREVSCSHPFLPEQPSQGICLGFTLYRESHVSQKPVVKSWDGRVGWSPQNTFSSSTWPTPLTSTTSFVRMVPMLITLLRQNPPVLTTQWGTCHYHSCLKDKKDRIYSSHGHPASASIMESRFESRWPEPRGHCVLTS